MLSGGWTFFSQTPEWQLWFFIFRLDVFRRVILLMGHMYIHMRLPHSLMALLPWSACRRGASAVRMRLLDCAGCARRLGAPAAGVCLLPGTTCRRGAPAARTHLPDRSGCTRRPGGPAAGARPGSECAPCSMHHVSLYDNYMTTI